MVTEVPIKVFSAAVVGIFKVITWFAFATVKVADVDALVNPPEAAWVAVIIEVPAFKIVTVFPEIIATDKLLLV
jgi:hypothetical protein